jgi:hypothetical protein
MVDPTRVAHYGRMVQDNLGEATDEQYRLWFIENCPHGAPEWLCPQVTDDKDSARWTTRLVDYDGVTAEALRSLIRWVERDEPPQPNSKFSFSEDGALQLADTPQDRRGIQPVVSATVNGGVRADVKVGESVNFEGTAEMPAGAGSIVIAQWDFEGAGSWPHTASEVDGESSRVTSRVEHAFDKPGTYLASFRVGVHRDGSKGDGPPVRNLARVRIVVTE